nr:hypothetical protein P5630_00030 [Bacillus subtilis]
MLLSKTVTTEGLIFLKLFQKHFYVFAMGFELNRGTGGDAKDPNTNQIIESKATSNWDRDTTSFSPSEDFDVLYFLRLNQRDDELYIYDTEINSDDLKSIQVNKTQTLGDQQAQGRRPRFSVIKFIIEANDIKPVAKVELRTKKIIKL